MYRQRGFTLVELLVVIAIIGILVAVISPNFNAARESARNNAIKTELKEVQLAIEVYRAQEGRYPPVDTSAGSCHDDDGDPHTAENSNGTCRNYVYIDGVTPDFIAELPESRDSNNSNCALEYQVDANGGWYKLTAVQCLEGADNASQGIQVDTEFARCPRSCITANNCTSADLDGNDVEFYESMAVYSAGGECE